MSEWTIYSKSNVAKAVVHELEYHGEWMRDEYVTVTVKSAEPVDWQFDDYLTYRGEVFSISYDPNVVKKARRGTYSEGFTYDNIKLYSLGSKAKQIDFKDVVLNPASAGNTQVYTSLGKFPFFCASVEDLADRLQANFNRETLPLLTGGFKVLTPSSQRTGQRLGSVPAVWSDYYTGNEPTGETDVNIDVDNMKCWDVLKFCYEKFGLAYFIRGEYIIIGAKPIHLNTGSQNIFRYGKGLGLYEIERTSDEDQEVVTKLFAYGSSKNLPLNYYANLFKKPYLTGIKATAPSQIAGEGDDYFVNTDITYASVRSALPYSANAVVVTNNTGSVSCVAYAVDYPKEVTGIHCLRLNLIKSGKYAWIKGEKVYGNAEAFYAAISDNERLYITYGVKTNMWPESYIENTGDYPSMLSIMNLMLPGFPTQSLHAWVSSHHPELLSRYTFSTNAKDPWIKSNNVSVAGIFEGVVNYDGSQQKEIFPTIEGATDGSGRRLDEVSWAQQMDDSGYLGDKPSDSALQFLFMPSGDASAIDWNDHDEEMTISMKDGACVAREFKVKKVANNQNGDWELTLERAKDSSTDRYYPYREASSQANLFQVMGRGNYQGQHTGDHFVITGINMQKSYIDAAAERMLIASCGYLDKRDHVRYTYLPKIDELFMQRDKDERDTESYHDIIRAGMMLEFEDSDLGIWHAPFIDNLTIKENGNNGIPTYDVVLRDEKEKGTLEKLTDSISELMANPPVQVVERQQRQLQYVEYAEWDENGLYYSETVNPDTDVLETSMVWHRGCLWMCRRTLTQQEPWLTSPDWECVRMTNINLGFYTDTEPPTPILSLNVRPQNVDEYVKPYLLLGQEDITEIVTAWEWVRESGNELMDLAWKENVHTDPEDPDSPLKSVTRTLHITNADLPSGWDTPGNRLSFKCTATFPYGNDEAEIMNSITII